MTRSRKLLIFTAASIMVAVLSLLALIVVWPEVAYYRQRIKPSELYIHLESLPWKSITIQPPDNAAPLLFEPSSGQVRVSPITYGRYRLGILLTNGQMTWSEYYHGDAGVRRRVDTIVMPSSGRLRFRQIANQTEVLFEGEVRPEDATEQNPFCLKWF